MNQIHNPSVPFNAPIPGGMHPGKMVKVHGLVPATSHRFAVNLMVGPMSDIALHVCPKFHDKHVIRNSVQNMHWGHEEKHGHMPIHPGQTFELLILCDPHHYKIAFNGHHFAEFHHRLPYSSVTNLGIDGEVLIYSITFEGSSTHAPPGHMGLVPPHASYIPPPGVHPPHHSAGIGVPYPTNHHNPVHHAGSPYPHTSPVYPPPGGIATQPHSIYPQQPNYPTAGNYPHSPNSHKKQGFLDKAGMAVAGALGTSALAGGLGGHKSNKGILGGALGTAVAGAALTGHLNPVKAMKKQAKAQRKAQKKALKYGLPIAAGAAGAYALHKGLHHHHGFHHRHHGSSSSSSSSSD